MGGGAPGWWVDTAIGATEACGDGDRSGVHTNQAIIVMDEGDILTFDFEQVEIDMHHFNEQVDKAIATKEKWGHTQISFDDVCVGQEFVRIIDGNRFQVSELAFDGERSINTVRLSGITVETDEWVGINELKATEVYYPNHDPRMDQRIVMSKVQVGDKFIAGPGCGHDVDEEIEIIGIYPSLNDHGHIKATTKFLTNDSINCQITLSGADLVNNYYCPLISLDVGAANRMNTSINSGVGADTLSDMGRG